MKPAVSLLCLLLLASGVARAGPRTPAELRRDSLYSAAYVTWPVPTQLRLAFREPLRGEAPRLVQLLRTRPLVPVVRAEILMRLTRAYIDEVQPSRAVQQLLEVRRIGLTFNDSTLTGRASGGLCYAYQLLQQPRKGLAYGEEALRFCPAGKTGPLCSAYLMMGECAMRARDYALALRYYQQSQRYSGPGGPDSRFTYNYNLADASLHLGDERLARRYRDSVRLNLAAWRLRPGGVPRYATNSWQELEGNTALQHGQYARGAALLEGLARQARRRHDLMLERGMLEKLPAALTRLGRYREAMAYQTRYVELLHTMYQEQAGRQAAEMEALYDTQRQEQEAARQRRRAERLQAQARQRDAESRQRLWLFGAVLVGVALALGGVLLRQRVRLRRAARQQAEALRTRIAADLHDEVGTLLTRVSLQAELLREQPTPADLDRLLVNSRAAAHTMRDIVWGIDAQADTLGALLDRMRDYLYQLATPAGLATELHAAGLPEHEPLPAECRQHLYLIFKEAVANVLRHAPAATQLTVTLTRPAGHLALTVENDGPPVARLARSGMGLRNMRQRAAALHGQLYADPRPAGGFRVHLVVPGC